MRRALLTGPALIRYNLFDNLTPQYNDNGDATGFTYGTRFFSDAAGRVVAIRFYKGLNNGGGNSHTVALYSSSGSLLASAATANEPASGWVTTNLPTPVTITANTPYTAAVFFPTGHAVYSDTFFTSQYNSPPLHAYANGNGGNGVYNLADTLQFPASFFNEGYFIDAVVETTGEILPPPPSGTMLIGAYESIEVMPYAYDWIIPRLDDMANSGFNLVINYSVTPPNATIDTMLWYADRCHERGMKTTWELRIPPVNAYWSTGTAIINSRPQLAASVGGSNDQQFMTNLINALKVHPATYAYYITDEPDSNLYPYLKQHAQLIKAADPSTDRHVCVLLGWWYASPQELDLLNSPDIDLIGIDYYPWAPGNPDFLPSNQAEWTNMSNRIASVYQWCEQHGKLFIGVPQAFGFDAYDCTGTPANSWPPESVMRSMNDIWRQQAPNMAAMVLYSYFNAVQTECIATKPADFWAQAIRAFQVGQ